MRRGIPITDEELDAVIAAIRELTTRHGYPPTVRELQDHLRLSSTSLVTYRLQRLRRRGRVTWLRYQPRTLVVAKGDRP